MLVWLAGCVTGATLAMLAVEQWLALRRRKDYARGYEAGVDWSVKTVERLTSEHVARHIRRTAAVRKMTGVWDWPKDDPPPS